MYLELCWIAAYIEDHFVWVQVQQPLLPTCFAVSFDLVKGILSDKDRHLAVLQDPAGDGEDRLSAAGCFP